MSDEGEKTCPLCAEEMDLTDQQLRPCKCGYDICVWCWHHIMDMAEKDDTEGRCPACRSPYNKEKIVGTASKCERLVAEMSVEKKQKSQKGKTKTSEGRKQLSSVRVIQRNLVYIVGLPLNLADEDLLQRKEYFGQYGKVLKVSISRTAAGAIQHFANNTCSVYITYSKEDEAVRSIQSVHGYVLEGRPLRACFGTTKYCHAWLRNMPCTNPDCLYLHEFGSQEDSFTKDEIISEYTRGRVQQVTGATTNEMQRRSGNMLPPAADDYSINSSSAWGGRPISKTTTNDPANSTRGSPPNSSSGRSASLPAAASWGTTHASNSQPLAASVVSSNGSSKQKVENGSTISFSSHGNESIKKNSEEIPAANGKSKLENPESKPVILATDHRKTVSDIPAASISSNLFIAPEEKDLDVSDEGRIRKLSSDMSSISIDKHVEPFASKKEKKPAEPVINNNYVTRVVPDLQHNKVAEVAISEAEADLLSFNDQRLRDPEVVTHTSYVQNNNIPQSSHQNNSMGYSISPRQHLDRNSLSNGHSYNVDGDSLFEGSNGNGHSYFPSTQGSRSQMGIFDEKSNGNGSIDLGENSIISNILSMDFDPWDESLTSPQHLAKLLGDSNKQQGSQRLSGSSRKTQSSNQSRFSFAREEDGCVDQGSNFTQSLTSQNIRNFSQLSDVNGFSSFNLEESDRMAGNHSSFSSNKISVSRSQISAPPGFMGPSRAPPPGFASNERIDQTYDNLSGNHMFENSLMRKVNQQHQAPAPVYNNGVSELEFMDPAILAIGGRVAGGVDMRSNFSGGFENDNSRLRLLMQRSFSQQNQRYSEPDAYGVSSRIMEQSVPSNRSFYQQGRMSNGHWDGWNEVESSELMRNERLGLSKYYSAGGYEDTTKLRMASSGDMYNRRYGI